MRKRMSDNQRKRKVLLFELDSGTPVYYGDVLYHPDRRRVGWYCKAEFMPNDDGDTVTVRAEASAVPTVLISELLEEPPIDRRCHACGQILPNINKETQ